MAIIYFPKSANLGFRDSFNPTYESLILATNPNTVLYMDYSSGINAATASNLYITASWAQTASISILFSSNSLSSSYSETASFALNAGGGGGGSIETGSYLPITSSWASNISNIVEFTTLQTSSTNWVTISLSTAEQFITLTGPKLFNFTCSNLPNNQNEMAYTTLYINYITTNATSSLVFPSSWIFIGAAPNGISASKAAVLSLRSYGSSPIVASYAVQY